MTLCTVKLNMGSTLFLAPPLNVLALVCDETSDLSELLLLSAAPSIGVGSSSADMGAGLSDRGFESGKDEVSTTWEIDSTGGRSIFGVVGVTGAEAVISVLVDAARSDTPETDRSRARVSLTTSWICKLRGFLAEVGGGRTIQ